MSWILFGLAFLVLLLLFCPLWLELHYRNETLKMRVRLLGIKIMLIGGKDKAEKKPEKPKKAKKAQEEEVKPTAGEKKKAPLPLMDLLGIVNDLLPAGGKAMGFVLRHTAVRRCAFRMVIQGEDAADTGIKYGQTVAVCYNIYVFLASYLKLREWKADLVPNFTDEKQDDTRMDICLSVIPAVVLWGALRLLCSCGFTIIKDIKKPKTR